MRCPTSLVMALGLALLCCSSSALAQQPPTTLQRPAAVVVGGGILANVADSYDMTNESTQGEGILGMGYAAFFVAPRIAVGAELARVGARSPEWGDYPITNWVLHATLRARATLSNHVGFDVLGGVGPQYYHTDVPSAIVHDATYLSFSVGADVPISVDQRVVVSPFARLYFLGREQTHYVHDESWRRFAVGVTVGVTFQ